MKKAPEDIFQTLGPGVPECHSGEANSTPQAVTFSGYTKFLVIQNSTIGRVLEVSFDGGTTFMRVPGGDSLAFPCRVTALLVRSTSPPVDYCVLATV